MSSKTAPLKCLVALAAVFSAWSLARAQLSVPAPPPTNPGPVCSDFERNPDGSWSPIREVNINGVVIGTGAAINLGTSFGGIDLAQTLNERCQSPSGLPK
jgi:hypothetical protein